MFNVERYNTDTNKWQHVSAYENAQDVKDEYGFNAGTHQVKQLGHGVQTYRVTVQVALDWCDSQSERAGERFELVEWNGDRGFICPIDWEGAILPRELIRAEHIR